jgi:hypothetical protein
MKVAPTCTAWTLHVEGAAFAMIRYGEETRHGATYRADSRCHDCWVEPGGFHHPGCDWAECPRCRGQLLGCDCDYDEDAG